MLLELSYGMDFCDSLLFDSLWAIAIWSCLFFFNSWKFMSIVFQIFSLLCYIFLVWELPASVRWPVYPLWLLLLPLYILTLLPDCLLGDDGIQRPSPVKMTASTIKLFPPQPCIAPSPCSSNPHTDSFTSEMCVGISFQVCAPPRSLPQVWNCLRGSPFKRILWVY